MIFAHGRFASLIFDRPVLDDVAPSRSALLHMDCSAPLVADPTVSVGLSSTRQLAVQQMPLPFKWSFTRTVLERFVREFGDCV